MRRAAGLWAAALALLVATGSGCYRRWWHYEESARIDAVIGRGWEPLKGSEAYGIPVPRDESVIAMAPARAERTPRASREAPKANAAPKRPASARQKAPARASKSGSAKSQSRTDFRFSGF